MAYYDRLKQARKTAGMTQSEVADLLGISKATYSGYETGKHEPTMLNIANMLRILSISANWLWQDELNVVGVPRIECSEELNDDNESVEMPTMYEFESILSRIKECKAISGLTNEELSRKSGVSVGTLNKVLSKDTREPKLQSIISIADALGVSADYLIFGTRNEAPADTVTAIVNLLQEMNADGQAEVLKFANYTLSQVEYKKA